MEQEYFLDYEKLTNHTDENFLDDFEDDDDELDRNDILLPWLVLLAKVQLDGHLSALNNCTYTKI